MSIDSYRENLHATVSVTGDGGVQVFRQTSTTGPGYLDLVIHKDSTWTLWVTLYQPGSSQPMNLGSAYTAAFNARLVEDGAAKIALTSSSGITLSTGEGNIKLSLAGTATAVLSFTRAMYDLSITATSGTVVTPVLTGNVDLVPMM